MDRRSAVVTVTSVLLFSSYAFPDPNAEYMGVPVKEFRAAVIRPFWDGRLTAGVNMLIATGHTGQTLENFAPSDVPQVAGVRTPTYSSISLTWHFANFSPWSNDRRSLSRFARNNCTWQQPEPVRLH